MTSYVAVRPCRAVIWTSAEITISSRRSSRATRSSWCTDRRGRRARETGPAPRRAFGGGVPGPPVGRSSTQTCASSRCAPATRAHRCLQQAPAQRIRLSPITLATSDASTVAASVDARAQSLPCNPCLVMRSFYGRRLLFRGGRCYLSGVTLVNVIFRALVRAQASRGASDSYHRVSFQLGGIGTVR